MSNALSDYLESGLLKHIFLGETFSKPSNIAIALTSGEIFDHETGETILELASGDGTNLSGYSRVGLGDPSVNGDSTWTYDIDDHNAGSGLIKNSSSLSFDIISDIMLTFAVFVFTNTMGRRMHEQTDHVEL